MTRAIHLTAYFLVGCIASTILAWMGGLHPALTRFAVAIYLLVGMGWLAFLLFDDALLKPFRLTLLEYRAVLIATMVATLIGIATGVMTCLQSI
ncbi:hypothetical protein BST81_25420 [Leptolyngbya sp. 'hensonii']|uniref:hypothetical protein n=1 Tax=Leptolyngbya sp. 'hensonii' TaxID=1922337 RepID=UPI00094F7AF7|nr:hypothetical protein [Leptolyngbya sp. 'hensonii']OLP15616.1 hypothetical protein BST81_25420 [Leptolyngbya sp. 'hensonii']